MKAVLGVVDMPHQRAALLIRVIHQNKGKLSKGKRDSFSELSDEEISRIESAINTATQQFQPAEANPALIQTRMQVSKARTVRCMEI
jgi:hypothetical protein